ncbi:MAG: Rne/Rng family ribonuclease [Actinomycetota bacterium]
MPKQIIIAEQHRIAAVFSEDQIQELVVATGSHQVSDIYLGIVENVLPGIDAAFVNIGDPDRNGFMHVTDLGPLRLKRSAGAITELLAPQQKVLVQVMKEPTGTKGPRLTGNITLPGRYLVLMPYGRGVNLSRRIKAESERNRLRALAILIKPAGMGLLVRTEAEGMTEDAIIEDLEVLQKQWEAIQQEASSTRAPALLNRDDDFIQRVLRDMYSNDVNRIVVDSANGIKRVKQHLMNWYGGKVPPGVLIDHHRERITVLEYFRVNAAIREALRPRVDLPSGGYIIIQPTEALTVIDVNSGSFTRSATARETVLWTNCEAATEIARQLRLRNIAGVIIVDFIDMESRRDQLQVLEHFNKALKADKARPQIAQLSELGLVELTRKRQGQNIYELFGQTCPTCGGLGHLVHLPGEEEATPAVRESTSDRTERTSLREERSTTMPSRSLAIPGEGMERRSVSERSFVPTVPTPAPSVREERNPPESWRSPGWEPQAEPLDYESTNNIQSLELINHPSYQDLSNNPRRRRRRRVGEGTFGREEDPTPTRTSLRIPSSSLASVEGRSDLMATSGMRGTSEAYPLSNTSSGRHSGEFERTRPGKPEIIKPILEPPEVIAVEMTPEEQDVYALMGVSPLVLLNRTVKNPKNAIVSVTLPGQGGNIPSLESLELKVEPRDDSEQEEEEDEEDEELEYLEPAIDEEPVFLQEFDAVPDEITDEVAAPEPTPLEISEVEEATSVNRRRRRRSSATSEE